MINLVEILKDCPQGMELDCPIFEGVEFDHIDENNGPYPIICRVKSPYGGYNTHTFTEYGCYQTEKYSKCTIFPKGKTTWEGFQRPFKDGDVLVHTQNQRFIMSIYHKRITEFLIKTHCILWDKDEGLSINMNICCYPDNTRLASEEEKQKLFDAIKDNGYKWNDKTKNLEPSVKPIFKTGDRIKHKGSGIYCTLGEYAEGISAYYTNIGLSITYKDMEQWELAPNKFDVSTLKSFESRVLVRNSNNNIWKPAIFGFSDGKRICVVSGALWDPQSSFWEQAIPYEGNEHLLGTADNCDEFYKTW